MYTYMLQLLKCGTQVQFTSKFCVLKPTNNIQIHAAKHSLMSSGKDCILAYDMIHYYGLDIRKGTNWQFV